MFIDSLGFQFVTQSFWLTVVEDSFLLDMGGYTFQTTFFYYYYFLSAHINLIADTSWCVVFCFFFFFKGIISCIKTCSINSRIWNENNPPKGVHIPKLLNYSMKTSPSAASTRLKRSWGNYLVLFLKVYLKAIFKVITISFYIIMNYIISILPTAAWEHFPTCVI